MSVIIFSLHVLAMHTTCNIKGTLEINFQSADQNHNYMYNYIDHMTMLYSNHDVVAVMSINSCISTVLLLNTKLLHITFLKLLVVYRGI